MGHRFEHEDRIELDVPPERIWEAIATGPGVTSWFIGRTEVVSGEGGTVRTAFNGITLDNTITAWEPGRRLAYGTGREEDGRFAAFEFLIEGRESGSTVLRIVTSGFLPGEDWEDEFEAMTKGNALFVRTLAEFVSYFPGRTAVSLTADGPLVTDWPSAWKALGTELGIGELAEGAGVRFSPPGSAPVDGVVYFRNTHTLGIRTEDALFRFVKGFHGPMMAMHHLFSEPADTDRAERAWADWLTEVIGRPS